jgi:serine/threonine-protein kinase SRPK3
VFVALRPPDDYQETIASYLVDHPSTTHPPRDAPFLSPDPIITVKSEPLPNFGLRPDLSNLHVDLMDFSAGKPVVINRRQS